MSWDDIWNTDDDADDDKQTVLLLIKYQYKVHDKW